MARTPDLRVVSVPTDELVPYSGNAKIHPQVQVEQIAASILEFGNCDPIGVWHNEQGGIEIVEGHGRLLALKRLGIKTAPVIFLDHLTDEQRRAYALVHNQLTMNSGFDLGILQGELDAITDIDMAQFDVSVEAASDWFEERERNDDSRQEGNDEYNDFLEKFEAKKTTDDCYTPDLVYDAVADWVSNEYGIDRKRFVRPFYPNGDYQRERYPRGCAVVDNPPFSILTEILRFYVENGVRFFLFAPTLTLFTGRGLDLCYMPVGASVTYENGANVNTSFITNMESDYRVRVEPSLYDAVKQANDMSVEGTRKAFPKYVFPPCVVTAASLSRYAVHGVGFALRPEECFRISELDSMKEVGKGLFGGGFLISDGAAKRNEAAEAQREENKRIEESKRIEWKISDREREIIASLGRKS